MRSREWERHRPHQARIDGWSLTPHAYARCRDRLPDADDLRAALRRPAETRAQSDGREYRVHGTVALVVDPTARRIITVMQHQPH